MSEVEPTREDCLAGKIAADVMRRLGFREPMKHPKWEEIADSAQRHIDDAMETMARVATRPQTPPPQKCMFH